MADKPEVFLEIGAGFFRIPTAEANFNITVLGVESPGAPAPVLSPAASAPVVPAPVVTLDVSGDDGGAEEGFYQAVSNDLYNDIGHLAKSLSSTMMEIPAEDRQQKRVSLDEAGDKIEDAKGELKDIVDMTEKAAMEIMDNVEKVQDETGDMRDLLDQLKNHAAFNATGGEPEAEAEAEDSSVDLLLPLRDQLSTVLQTVTEMGGDGEDTPPPAAPEPVMEKKTRYLFDLDVIFQTLYELCTNETVKDHITAAREKAGEIIDTVAFQDAISVRASKYEADGDNYYDVPMSDVFQTLFAACNDNGTKNLLKKMDKGQATIFLDQVIPVEVPATEEVEFEVEGSEEAPSEAPAVEPDPRLEQLQESVQGCLTTVDDLDEQLAQGLGGAAGMSLMSLDDQQEIFAKIEAAFGRAASITKNVSNITEALSFQDLSGQRIMKIIKLLGDFQVQLLAIVVSFGSQLKQREKDDTLSIEETKALAQADVDKFLSPSVDKDGDEKQLDQDTVNAMLEDLGF